MNRVVRIAARPIILVWALLIGSAGPVLAAESLVHKTAETFDDAPWPPEGWNKAFGVTSVTAETAPAGKCLEVEVRFSGKGFEWFGAVPSEPLVVPGDLKSVKVQYKLGDKRYPLVIKFKDGWGRSEVGSKKLEWGLPEDTEGQWKTATFKVPADWIRPVTIAGLATHNWSQESQARAVRFWLDEIEVETDLADVDPQTGLLKTWKPDPQPKDPKTALSKPPRTPLRSVALSTGRVSNVFAGEQPSASIRVRNWSPGKLRGTLTAEVVDQTGKACDRQERPVEVESTADLRLSLKAERFGLYTLNTTLTFADGVKETGRINLARLAPIAELSAAEKAASPYGVNVNGGRESLAIEAFRKAGIVWFRDYGFSYDWLTRAKGDDRRYAGWPWYPTIMRRYHDAGAMVLPCLMRSIRPPQKAGGSVRLGPDRAWVREIADVLLAFPEMTCWELDNEYDLSKEHADAEASVGWKNYQAYHRRLAEIVDLLGGGEVTTVEQGAAGIYPERVKQSVDSGEFAKVGVVNSHYYCGTETPETNIANWNTDSGADFRRQPPMLLLDRLRAVKRAAAADGRARESWLTEFGWDTLAGPKVSPAQQAAYLARGWMVALAAGTDKCFWFFDYDAPEPKQFFDGCGLLAADGSAKLSLCAMAGLASALPNPKYVGSFNLGPGTCGYVFTTGGQRVAAAWTIDEPQGPSVTFRAKELRDYLGNRLAGLSTRLSPAPVYAIGLDADDPAYRQTAYELNTNALVGTTAGDPVPVVLDVRNNRTTPIEAKVRLSVPQGWTVDNAEAAAAVPPGKSQSVTLTISVPPNEPMGSKDAMLTMVERDVVKQIPLRILVQPGITLAADALRGQPGVTKVTVKLGNRSAKPISGVLRLELPKAWKAAAAEIPIKDLKPDETRPVECGLTWNTQWRPGEQAAAVFDVGGGRTILTNLIPTRFRLPKVKKITLDGRSDDWSAEAQLPSWMLGGSSSAPAAKISLAWAPDGLYGLVEVAEADVDNPDPRSFWGCNCLELFLDTRDDKHDRTFAAGDHQFWFVPMPAEHRVYAGQWKRGDETPETRYDLRTVEGVAVAKGRGYVMEFRLPSTEIKNFPPASGRTIGLNLNLTLKTKQGPRELSWPTPKNAGAPGRPSLWGTVELGE